MVTEKCLEVVRLDHLCSTTSNHFDISVDSNHINSVDSVNNNSTFITDYQQDFSDKFYGDDGMLNIGEGVAPLSDGQNPN